jgi:hypothetical protein
LFHDFREDPMNSRLGEQLFEGLRQSIWGLFGGFYTHTEESMKQDDFRHMMGGVWVIEALK